ncbi:protein FAM161A isoform X2 [Dendropsophus ebraccatus]|uniref:protein FAM161A isoform X2 n=1 Tax=Dendropsophus ebraccatus TaxID=150705 RepID=UPI003831BB33
MATSHQDSVLAASCIRTPVHPRTRAPRTLYERQEEEEKLRVSREQPGPDDLDSDTERESCKITESKDWILDICRVHRSDREYYMQLERLKNAHVVHMEQLEKMYDNKLNLHGVQDTPAAAKRDYWSAWEQKSLQPTECECCFLKHNVSSSGLSVSSVDEPSDGEDDSDASDSVSVTEKIGHMWNEFTVEDYIKKSDFGKCKSNKSQCKEWSHRVTIPQPFEMTIRESKKKEMNVKSKSEIEMENNLLKKRLEEEAECQKKFRANPVPASVYLPLYDEIVKRNEERRDFVKERSKEILLASQKPFMFTEREERKKQERKKRNDIPESVPSLTHFRAKPVPKSIYGTSANERLKEEELYREIRIHMRSEELLRSSSYPTSTLACTNSSKSEKARCQEAKKQQSHRPKINTQIPNFKILHENHQKHLLKNKDTKHVTICEPFNLRTSNIQSHKGKILKDIETDEEKLKETRWPYKSPRNQSWKSLGELSPREEAPVVSPRSTESSKWRELSIRKSIEEKLKQEEEEKKKQTRRREREKTLKKHISRKARAIHPDPALRSHSKLKELRKSEKRRAREYMEELNAMKERVSKTPLLLERTTQKNARLWAEKHYSNMLRDLGLSDDFVSVKGQTAALWGPKPTKEDTFNLDDEERSSEGTLEVEDLQEDQEADEIQRNQSEDEKYGEYSSDEDHIEEEV